MNMKHYDNTCESLMNLKSKRKNLTRNIREILAGKILGGELLPGTPLASNKELAEEFGVSLLTADRAVRQLVDEGLVYREQGRGTFVKRNIPKTSGGICRIGIADRINYPVIPIRDVALDIRPRTIIQYLKEHQCETRLMDYEEVRDGQILKKAAADLDGIIVSSAYLDPVTIRNLSALSIPVVATHHEFSWDLPFHQVMLNHDRGVCQAVAEALKYDFPEIIVVHEDHRNGIARRDAFLDRFKECGYPERQLRPIALADWALRSGVPSYRLAVKLIPELKGKLLISTSDIVSISMMEAFSESGLTPGKEFQLLSYDNLEGCGYQPFGRALFTSIDSVRIRIAERSSQLILDKVKHPADEIVIIRIPTELVIRETAFAKEKK